MEVFSGWALAVNARLHQCCLSQPTLGTIGPRSARAATQHIKHGYGSVFSR